MFDPPSGAAAESVTVPVAPAPPIKDVGLIEKLKSPAVGGRIASATDLDKSKYSAEIVTDCLLDTGRVEIWNETED